MAEDALFGAGFFLVAPRPADERVKAKFINRLQQRDGLVRVARLVRAGQAHRAPGHAVFDVAHNQLGPQLLGPLVAVGNHFREVVAGVDHQQRKRQAAHAKGFFRALEHDQRILAAREQQRGALKRGGHFAQDEDGLFLQGIQVAVADGRQHIMVHRGIHDNS